MGLGAEAAEEEPRVRSSREVAFAVATLAGAGVGFLFTRPVLGGAVLGGASGFVIGGLIAGGLRLDAEGLRGRVAPVAADERVVTASLLRRVLLRAVLLALTVASVTAVIGMLLLPPGRGSVVIGGFWIGVWTLPFGFWLGATSLVELVFARLRPRVGFGLLVATLTWLAAFAASFFAVLQFMYVQVFLETGSVEKALEDAVKFAHELETISEGATIAITFETFAIPVGVLAFLRFKAFPLRAQVPLALGATVLLAAPSAVILASPDRGMGFTVYGIALGGAVLLPLVAWSADAIERRFVTWSSRES
jgi:hypothetical protein